jgi:2-keto-4-pentenoate hydratase
VYAIITTLQSAARRAAPRLEPEIAFKLRAPVPVGCKDPATILQAVEWLQRVSKSSIAIF